MKKVTLLLVLGCSLFCLTNLSAIERRTVPPKTAAIETTTKTMAKKKSRAEQRAARKAKRLEKKMQKIEQRFEGEEYSDILDDRKFQLGALLLAGGIGFGLLAALGILSGLFGWLAGIFALVGLFFLIWALIEYYD